MTPSFEIRGALLGDLAERGAALAPDRPAIMLPDGTVALTYRALAEGSARFAAFLASRGCRRGDRVMLTFNNTPAFFTALFGVMRAGAIAIPIDMGLATADLRAIVANAEPFGLLAGPGTPREKLDAIASGHRIFLVDDHGVPSGGAERAPDPGPPSLPEPSDVTLILYTSGTTGIPKGVMHTHTTVTARLDSISSWFGFREGFRWLCVLPTHFGHGLICNCLATFYYGGTLVLAAPFNVEIVRRIWSIVDHCGVNAFSTVPAVVRLLLLAERRTRARATPLELVTCASAPLRAAEVEDFEASFGIPLLNCYGITETASWTAFSPNDPGRDRGSVGTAFRCEIAAVDPQGRRLPPGEEGDLWIRGPSVMKGYYRDPVTTAQALREGWFVSGDVGKVSERGEVYLLARKKEMINRAGMKIYPPTVDAVLMSHPAIAEAYCVGLEDRILGEIVGACVVLRPGQTVTANQIIAFARANLAAYQCPQRVEVVPEIPKNARGKVNRQNLTVLFR